jgi:formamidopyrimidine-DNA glycosylase
MPELPEAETVRRGLALTVLESKIESIEVSDARCLKKHPGGEQDFKNIMIGRTFKAAVRRGKFIWLPLDLEGFAMVMHLGMSGQALIRTQDFQPESQVRLHMNLENGLQFRFSDQRLFGSLMVDQLQTTEGNSAGFSPETAVQKLIPSSAAHIARDPLDEEFDLDSVKRKLMNRTAGIKHVILDQQLVSGIGNIYADESLWRARLNYNQPANSISSRKLTELFGHVQDVLREAVEQGGTSFDQQYKNINGQSGYFSQKLNAYGQAGKPCNRCGGLIIRKSWENRGSHFCPSCQRIRKQKLK